MERDRSVGRWLGMLHRYARLRFGKAAAAHDLDDRQFPILMGLYRNEGASQDELATHHLLDKATIARAVARLEKAGYVVRRRDEHDGRIKRVALTPKARRIEPELREIRDEWSEVLTEGFSEQEREALLSLLERMVANAERYMERERQ